MYGAQEATNPPNKKPKPTTRTKKMQQSTALVVVVKRTVHPGAGRVFERWG